MAVTTFAGQQAYLANARSVGLRWRGYLGFAALPVMLIAVAWATPPFPGKQFDAGVAVGSVVMMFTLSVARFDSRQMRGHLAERFSVESLRKVPGWTVIDNLPFDGIDVDHVVITPSGVLAVETKFFGLMSTGPYERERAAAARRSAMASARKVRLFLKSKKLSELVPVMPVLMVWGPGSPDFAEGYRVVDGVYVLQSDQPRMWSHLFQELRVSAVHRAVLRSAIDDYLAKKRLADAQQTLSLRTRMWAELREGVRVERAARTARRAQVRRLRAEGHVR